MIRQHRQQRPQELGLAARRVEDAKIVQRDPDRGAFRFGTKLRYQGFDLGQGQDLRVATESRP
jgi:hypothetical protein